MKTVDLKDYSWKTAEIIFDFFKKETDCLDAQGNLLVAPKYVVCIDDDMVSAYYAAIIMNKALKQFGSYPILLCAGGIGMLSKYLNKQADGTVISEGEKLKRVCLRLGDFPQIVVLEKGNNTGAVLKEIIDYVNSDTDAVIFCPTQRMSKRLERTVAFSTEQFPDSKALNAYWYVHGESLSDMLQLYNGKILAGGLPLLSEAAALYDRIGTDKYVGKYQAEYDGNIPKYVRFAGYYLVQNYPVRGSRSLFSAPMQFLKMYLSIVWHRKAIAVDLEAKIHTWQEALL